MSYLSFRKTLAAIIALSMTSAVAIAFSGCSKTTEETSDTVASKTSEDEEIEETETEETEAEEEESPESEEPEDVEVNDTTIMTYPFDCNYENEEINELADKYVQEGFILVDILDEFGKDFDNMQEGFYGLSTIEEENSISGFISIYVIQFPSQDEALQEILLYFGALGITEDKRGNITIDFENDMIYDGTISTDGLVVLKTIEYL